MAEEEIKKIVSADTRRKLAAALTGRKRTPETIEKLKKAPLAKKFNPRCNKCSNRDGSMCARFNMRSFDARENVCFRMYMQRNPHPDYVKGVIVQPLSAT